MHNMSELYPAREPNRGTSELSAEEILATRQLVAAISGDTNLASPAQLLQASVTENDLQRELGIFRQSNKGVSWQAWQDLVDGVYTETTLRHSVASRRATRLILNLGTISETPDEISFMANLWNDPMFFVRNRGILPSQHDIFHLGLKVAGSHPEHAIGIGAAVASMTKPTRIWGNSFELNTTAEVSLRSVLQQYKHATENDAEGAAIFVRAYLQNKPPETLGIMYTLSEITSILSALKFSGGTDTTRTLGELAGKLDAYKLGILEPRKKQNDSLPHSGDCMRAAAALTVNLIDYLSRDQSRDSNAGKLKYLLDSQKVAHRDMLGSDMVFINIANGILKGNGSEILPGKSIESFKQALDIVIDAAVLDSRQEDKDEYADLVHACSSRLVEIAVVRNNFLPKVVAGTKTAAPGKVPAIKTTTHGQYRDSKDARTPGYGVMS